MCRVAHLVRLLSELTQLMPVRGVSSVAYILGGSSSSSRALGTTGMAGGLPCASWLSTPALPLVVTEAVTEPWGVCVCDREV